MLTRFRSALVLGFALLASPLASLACCPSDGNNPQKLASVGLGESFPTADAAAADATWAVYEFHRDGIRYVQANDRSGAVRAAVGRIGDTFWVLPIGVDADRVSVPGNGVAIPAYTSAKRVFGTDAIDVWVYQTTSGDWWAVTPAAAR